jgi:hypothetical protein
VPPTELPIPRPLPSAPLNGAAMAEPMWRSAGTQYVSGPANPLVADPWVAAGSRAAGGPAYPGAAAWRDSHYAQFSPQHGLTARAVSDAPPPGAMTPPSGVRQVAYTAPAPAALGRPHAVPPAAPSQPAPQRPAAPARPAPAAHAAPAGTARSIVTSLTHLKYSIERVCAGRGRDLQLHSRGPGSLLVQVRVATAADARFLADKISQIPELAPYQVIFEMRLPQ